MKIRLQRETVEGLANCLVFLLAEECFHFVVDVDVEVEI